MTYDNFSGIKINLYDNDHAPPHFHALYQSDEALIEIDTLIIIEGWIPPAQLKKVQRRFKNKKLELRTEFERISPKTNYAHPAPDTGDKDC